MNNKKQCSTCGWYTKSDDPMEHGIGFSCGIGGNVNQPTSSEIPNNSTNQDEFRDVWYEKLDDYVYWINRYSQRNQRKEREAKMHQLISEIQSEATKRQLEMLDRFENEAGFIDINDRSQDYINGFEASYSQVDAIIEAERNKLKEMK